MKYKITSKQEKVSRIIKACKFTNHAILTLFLYILFCEGCCWGKKHWHIARFPYGTKYSRIDQVKFVDETVFNFLKAVFLKFYLVISWIVSVKYWITFYQSFGKVLLYILFSRNSSWGLRIAWLKYKSM